MAHRHPAADVCASPTPPDRIVREAERRAITGTSRTAWWSMSRAGEAPAAVRLGARAVGWRLSELQAWIADRPVAR